MAWRLSTGDYGRLTADERGEHLRGLMEKADPPPGVLGFLDGEVAAGATWRRAGGSTG